MLKKIHEDKLERKRQMKERKKAELQKHEQLDAERQNKDAE